MVWVIAFGELFFGDLWCVVWGYGGMRTHFSLLNPLLRLRNAWSRRAILVTPFGYPFVLAVCRCVVPRQGCYNLLECVKWFDVLFFGEEI